MALAASVTFRLNQPSQSHSQIKTSFHLPFKPLLTFSPLHKHPKLQIAARSTDVSKEDIPPASEPIAETDDFDKHRLEEKFAVLNTGIYECRSCGYLYNEAAGYPSYPIALGLSFDIVPDDWRSIYQCLRKLWMNSVTKLKDEFYLIQ
ncbi:putative Rubredoxin domain-containing protein [Helianthus annuus]|nr:putative Rubredoxin domain-containing protein [Helianthus annuus]